MNKLRSGAQCFTRTLSYRCLFLFFQNFDKKGKEIPLPAGVYGLVGIYFIPFVYVCSSVHPNSYTSQAKQMLWQAFS